MASSPSALPPGPLPPLPTPVVKNPAPEAPVVAVPPAPAVGTFASQAQPAFPSGMAPAGPLSPVAAGMAPPAAAPPGIQQPIVAQPPTPFPDPPLPMLDPTFAQGQPMPDNLPLVISDPASPVAGRGPRGSDYESKFISTYVGGRAQLDAVDYITTDTMRRNVPGFAPLVPGVSFRRLRIDASGAVGANIEYLFQIDFVNALQLPPGATGVPSGSLTTLTSTDVAVPTDAWVSFKNLPIIGNIRVGNHKPYYSFEHLTSSRYLNFLERSIGFDAFAEGFNNGFEPGISAYDTYLDKRGTWGFGVFKNTRNAFAYNVGKNELDVNGRVTFLPICDEDGKHLVHVGVGASQRDPDIGQIRFRSRFDARNAPSGLAALVADTGLVNASQQYLLIPELAAVWGAFSMQSEYYGSWATNAAPVVNGVPVPQGSAFFHSWYIEGHLFLTGEHRVYSKNSAVFGMVKPNRPVEWTRNGFSGWGAWQLTARYTYLDLNSRQINGGRVNDMTLGLNWFLNQYAKVQWNFFLADRQALGTAGDGGIYGFGTRFALDF